MTEYGQIEPPKSNGKRGKLVAIAAAVITAATPGVYGAWQAAKTAFEQKTEREVNDKATGDLQAWAAAAKKRLDQLEQMCVTHRELVDFALKLGHATGCRDGWELRGNRCVKVRVVATAPPAPAPASKPPAALLDKLKAKAAAAGAAKPAPKLPALKPPSQIRALIEQKAAK